MAAVDPENINTAWAPLIIGLIGVGGVLLPSQVVFSIISPSDIIGTSVSLSIVVRAIGQVVGVSMFYNIFAHGLKTTAQNDLTVFAVPALTAGLKVPAGGDLVATITELITTLTAGPFSNYAHYFPGLDTPEAIATITRAGHNLYKDQFPILYLISIAWGGAACLACFLLTGYVYHLLDQPYEQMANNFSSISDFINDEVAVVL